METVKVYNIIDVGLTASAMIRLFKKGSKDTIREQIYQDVERVFEAKSRDDFDKMHSNFCDWGVKNISLAKKNKCASYGQIAKTLNVVLKVAIYYSHLPDCDKSRELSKWLHAAVDTKMMKELKKNYPNDIPWPATIEQVDKEETYRGIQQIVWKFIEEKHEAAITTPVEFEEIYWRKLNRKNEIELES